MRRNCLKNKVYNCNLNGRHIKSKVNNNEYYLTRKRIVVTDERQTLVKKIELPKTVDKTVNDRMLGFYTMWFDDEDMWVIISMRDYYDQKAILNEETLELGELSPFK